MLIDKMREGFRTLAEGSVTSERGGEQPLAQPSNLLSAQGELQPQISTGLLIGPDASIGAPFLESLRFGMLGGFIRDGVPNDMLSKT